MVAVPGSGLRADLLGELVSVRSVPVGPKLIAIVIDAPEREVV
jgi:hypothetical protein